MLVKNMSLSVMLKICLFFAIFEPRDAYKGDAYKITTCITCLKNLIFFQVN